jgi:hypothetical protein
MWATTTFWGIEAKATLCMVLAEKSKKVLDKKGGKAYNLEALEERTCFGRKVKEKHMGM